jgi:serine protease AprX
MTLQFVDSWKTFQFTRTGERKLYQMILPAICPELRFCLAYTDAPGRGLQNNINLMVQYPAAGGGVAKALGNQNLPDRLTLPDPDNNVETVVIQNAPAGTYLIQVVMSNLLKPGQDFALVVTGDGVPRFDEIVV